MKARVSTSLTLAGALLALSGAALAVPIFTFTGGATSNSFADRTFGYNFFTGAGGLTVTSLGFWDADGDGLDESHEVGIWDVTGTTLLASAVVGAGTSGNLDSGFRFVSIAPVVLAASTEFLAGAFLGANTDAVIRFTAASGSSGVTLGSTRFDFPVFGVFTAPTGTQGTNFDDGYFGPNLNGLTVPEPSTLSILGLGLLAGLGYRRRHS